jgi:nucleoside-diphosphate-sugar epimerase
MKMLVTGGAGFIGSQVYNVACGEGITVNDLVAELREQLDSHVEPIYLPARAGDVRHSLADISAARRDLGYEPTVLVREGLGRTIEYIRAELAADHGRALAR